MDIRIGLLSDRDRQESLGVAFDDGATATPAWIRQLAPILAGGFDLDNVTAIAATADGLWLAGYADPGGVFTGQILKLGLDGTVMGAVRLEGPGNPILRAVVALADSWLLRVHGLAAAPPFGTPGTAGVVSESPTSIANPTVAVAAWSSTSAAWAPTVAGATATRRRRTSRRRRSA